MEEKKYLKIKPSEEFLRACDKEAKRVANLAISAIPQGKDLDTQDEQLKILRLIFKNYGAELQKQHMSPDFAEGLMVSYSHLFSLLRHHEDRPNERLTAEQLHFHF